VLHGLVVGWLTYYIFDFALDRGFELAYAQTGAFVMIVFAQMFHIFDARTSTSLFRRNPFTNKDLVWAVAGSGLLSLAAVIASGLGSILMFLIGAIKTGRAYLAYFGGIGH